MLAPSKASSCLVQQVPCKLGTIPAHQEEDGDACKLCAGFHDLRNVQRHSFDTTPPTLSISCAELGPAGCVEMWSLGAEVIQLKRHPTPFYEFVARFRNLK